MARIIDFDMTEEMRKHVVMVVRPTGIEKYRVRMAIVTALMWLVARVAPFTVELGEGWNRGTDDVR